MVFFYGVMERLEFYITLVSDNSNVFIFFFVYT